MVKLKSHIIQRSKPAAKSDKFDLNYKRRVGKTDKTQRLGDKAPHDAIHNCLTCDRWAKCHDTNKGANFRCSRFKEAVIDSNSLDELFGEFNPFDVAQNTVKEEEIFKRSGDDEESILDMIAKVIDSNIPVPPDLRIGDNSVPLAKNFYEWCMDDRFAKGGMPPFPRQIEIGIKLFNEYCPRCSDVDWFDEMRVDVPLTEIADKVVFLNNGKCPECKGTKSEFVAEEELPDYFGVIGLAGQRAAKTTSMILWDSYNLHKVLKLPSPQSVFGTLPTQVITTTFAATTFAQAVENVWNPYLNTLRTTPWFATYHSFLDMKSEELGEELYNLGEHMVRYRHRNLLLSPSGPNKRTMRGRTRLTGAVDEIGWFPMAKKSGKNAEEFEKLDAKGVFTALNNSLFTLKSAYRRRTEEGYNDLPKPVMYAISSPSQYNDFIMSSFRTYYGSTEMMAWKYKTWEYNPLLKKKDFKEEFRLKPVEAARDYECNPPIGEGLFITDHTSLIKSFRHGPNKISIITRKTLSKTKLPMTEAEVRINSNNLPIHGTVLCVDVGLVNNSFAFSIIGPTTDHDPDILPEDRGTMQTPAKVYAVGEVIPKNGTRISLTSIFANCFVPLVEPFNIRYFVSDRWNNVKIAQDLEEGYEVTPLEHKCVWEDFETTRDLLYSGNLLLPKLTEPFDDIIKTTLDTYPECFRNRPMDHLAWQFATVRENTGVTVLKGDGGTDDLFRTIVLGVAQLQDDELLEDLLSVNSQQVSSAEFLSMVVKMKPGASAASKGGASSSITAVRRLRGAG